MHAERVKAVADLVEEIGNVNSRGFFLAPCHEDTKPSAHIYADGTRWHCFVCNEGGDVIDYVAKAERITNGEAIAYLSRKHSLGGPITPQERTRRDEQAEQRKAKADAHVRRMMRQDVLVAAYRGTALDLKTLGMGTEEWHRAMDMLHGLEFELDSLVEADAEARRA